MLVTASKPLPVWCWLQPPSTTKSRPYHDLEVVQELNAMQRAASKAAAGAERVADESKKWLEWEDYLAMVQRLRAECAGEHSSKATKNSLVQLHMQFRQVSSSACLQGASLINQTPHLQHEGSPPVPAPQWAVV